MHRTTHHRWSLWSHYHHHAGCRGDSTPPMSLCIPKKHHRLLGHSRCPACQASWSMRFPCRNVTVTPLRSQLESRARSFMPEIMINDGSQHIFSKRLRTYPIGRWRDCFSPIFQQIKCIFWRLGGRIKTDGPPKSQEGFFSRLMP